MSERIETQELARKADIVASPNAQPRAEAEAELRRPTEVDRSFELPTALYGVSVALYLAFLGVMFAGLANPGLIIPMAIFVIFIVGGFGVPALWTQIAPEHGSKPMTMSTFARDGIMTNTGRLGAKEAAVQMLILPVLIVVWGLAVVTIAAFA